MKNSKKKILLTGASGFLGRHTLSILKKYYDVYPVYRNKKVHDTVNGIFLDLALYDTFHEYEKLFKSIDIVVHLSSTIPCHENNDPYYLQNIMSTVNLIKAFPHVEKFLLASTVDVYGTSFVNPLTENTATHPENYYAISKLTSEYFVSEALKTHAIILRFSQIYGSGDNSLKIIPTFLHALKNNQQNITTGDLSAMRDYIFVTDAAEAIRLAIGSNVSGVFNVATGTSYKISDALEKIRAIARKEIIIHATPGKKIDYYFNINKAKNMLHFLPKTSLENGLTQMISNEL